MLHRHEGREKDESENFDDIFLILYYLQLGGYVFTGVYLLVGCTDCWIINKHWMDFKKHGGMMGIKLKTVNLKGLLGLHRDLQPSSSYISKSSFGKH